ncbi:MAG: replication initiation protein RepC, partial [Mesorhizobium sp.]
AEAVRSEKKAFRLVKERLTICRRDIVKMIDAGIEEGVPANWGRVQQAYQAIVGQIPRTAPRQAFEAIAEELEGLWAEVREALESFVKTQKVDANESRNGRHIQNSKPDSKFES